MPLGGGRHDTFPSLTSGEWSGEGSAVLHYYTSVGGGCNQKAVVVLLYGAGDDEFGAPKVDRQRLLVCIVAADAVERNGGVLASHEERKGFSIRGYFHAAETSASRSHKHVGLSAVEGDCERGAGGDGGTEDVAGDGKRECGAVLCG